MFRRIAAALMLSTSLTVAAIAISPRAEAADNFEVYANSGLTYCDAKLYGAFWKLDIDRAKAQIGEKIQRGMRDAVDQHVAEGRALASCDWADVPHSYEDAERIATAWGLANPGEAKDKIAYLYTQGRSADVVTALQQAPAAPLTSEEQAAWNAFQESDFTYCDAKLLGAAWSVDIDKAKAEIGYKILGGYSENLAAVFAQGRQTASCGFEDTQLTYDDAGKLASIWGVDVGEAKDKAAAYYTAGDSAIVLTALGGAPAPVARPTPIVTVPPAGKEDAPPGDDKSANEN